MLAVSMQIFEEARVKPKALDQRFPGWVGTIIPDMMLVPDKMWWLSAH